MLLLLLLIIKIAMVTVAIAPSQALGIAPSGGEDKDLYSDIARSLVAGHGYRVTADTAETMVRNPGYVLLRAGMIRLFGDDLAPARICNVLFGMGTVVLAGMLIRRFTPSIGAIVLTVLITALYPLTLLVESRIGVESMFTFLLMLGMLLLSRAMDSWRVWSFAVAGAVLGLATLTRSVAMFLIPVIAVLAIWAGSRERKLGPAVRGAVALAATAILVVSPWAVRNYLLSGELTFSESHVGIGAYQGWYTTATMSEGKPYQVRIDDSRQPQSAIAAAAGAKFRLSRDDRWDIYPTIQDELLYSHALVVEVWRYYQADPVMMLRHLAVNVPRFWFQGATDKLTILIVVMQLPLLLAAAAGVLRSLNRGPQLLLLLIPIVVIWGLHVPLIAHARYSVPLVPLLAVFAGLLVASWRSSGETAASDTAPGRRDVASSG